jgi:hypothetical protein
MICIYVVTGYILGWNYEIKTLSEVKIQKPAQICSVSVSLAMMFGKFITMKVVGRFQVLNYSHTHLSPVRVMYLIPVTQLALLFSD